MLLKCPKQSKMQASVEEYKFQNLQVVILINVKCVKVSLFHAQNARKIKKIEQIFVSPVFSGEKRIEVQPYQAAKCVFIRFIFVLHKLGQKNFLKRKKLGKKFSVKTLG